LDVKFMSSRRKVIVTLALLLVAALVVVAVVVPRLVDIDRYRPELVAQIEKATGKKTEIGRLSLSILPTLSIRVDQFALANPAGFPVGYLLTARRIYGVLDAAAFWQRQIVIKSLQLDQPVVHLLSNQQGRRNFDSPNSPGRLARVSLESGSPFSLGVISRIDISDGQLTDAALLPSGQPGPIFFEADVITAQLENVDLNAFTSPTPEELRQTTSELREGLGAWEGSLAYAAAPSSGSAGEGTFKAETLRFGEVRATSVKSRLRLGYRNVLLEDLRLDFYGGSALGSLSFNFAGPATRYSAEGQFHGVDLARLLAEFPTARGKMTGRMEGNLTFEGEITHSEDPLAGKRGKGQVIIRNGQLPTLRLNSNLMLLAKLSDFGPAQGDPSSFSSASADLTLANDRVTSRNIKIVGNGVGIDAAGVLALVGEGSLEYEGVAEVNASQNALTNVLAGLSGAKLVDGKLSFPFTLGGTLDQPRFRLKAPAGATGTVGAGTVQPDVVQGIMDLFKKQPRKP
jgi:uncharacterized protein involved in outer membrane biogenesis